MTRWKNKPRVRAIRRSEIGCSGEFVEAGRLGRVLGRRDDRVLVKWDRRAWPGDHPWADMERVTEEPGKRNPEAT